MPEKVTLRLRRTIWHHRLRITIEIKIIWRYIKIQFFFEWSGSRKKFKNGLGKNVSFWVPATFLNSRVGIRFKRSLVRFWWCSIEGEFEYPFFVKAQDGPFPPQLDGSKPVPFIRPGEPLPQTTPWHPMENHSGLQDATPAKAPLFEPASDQATPRMIVSLIPNYIFCREKSSIWILSGWTAILSAWRFSSEHVFPRCFLSLVWFRSQKSCHSIIPYLGKVLEMLLILLFFSVCLSSATAHLFPNPNHCNEAPSLNINV